MNRTIRTTALAMLLASLAMTAQALAETPDEHNARMRWWREARFGLFIHWGLYAVPAGEWDGKTEYGEWIRTSARIPLSTYDRFVGQFNPTSFDASAWVRMAKDAGMKYIVITSKHHDGFCLFDSKETDFDVMSTPFRRDIMKELSEACRKEGLTMCWYHSIMDWHHPDYLPRREWEKDRPTQGADFDRYVGYMKRQLRELLTNYGEIGVLWFDGEWESTWNTARGKDLYEYVRGLQPQIIVNNRVGAARSGMEGLTKEGEFGGDFGTPEQQIPATGLPGVDWETCMTMNDHWGYNRADQNWKSSKELVRMLADIASKGGNFLLNVGPTAEGLFPQASVERLAVMGRWMKTNGDAIHGTSASPFRSLPWGRCTQRATPEGATLYLHVFDWPPDGKLRVPGLFNQVRGAYLLADASRTPLAAVRQEDAVVVSLPPAAPDSLNSVVVLELKGKADVNDPPKIDTTYTVFIDQISVGVTTDRENVVIRYTTDGSVPTASSSVLTGPVTLKASSTVRARAFRGTSPVSDASEARFTKVVPQPSVRAEVQPGLRYAYVEGDWDRLPDFSALAPKAEGVLPAPTLDLTRAHEYYGVVFSGYVNVPVEGVYSFFLASDDGSRMRVDEQLLIDNDGLHGLEQKRGVAALEKGLHPVRIEYFNKTGGEELSVFWTGPGIRMEAVPASAFFHR